MTNIDDLKARVSLRDVLMRDGVQLRRAGSRWAACCPLHEERTPSFYVSTGRDGAERFKCFGCGKGGDVLDYWQMSRHTDLAGAREGIAAAAGLVDWVAPARPKPVRAQEQEVVQPMDATHARVWAEGVEWLLNSREEQERIAAWRGWRPETVQRVAQMRQMGMPVYRGMRREAFPVWVPGGAAGGGADFQAGYHVHTKELKGRFRFEPSGIGSWPFVIGKPQSCKVLVVLEGQWDAISFYDALSDETEFPEGVAVVGVRGASSWRKLMVYDWGQKVQAFVFADGDTAGQAWMDPDSLAGALRLRCRAVHPFICNEDGAKDFNDIHRLYDLSSAEWCEMLRAYCLKGLRTRGGGRKK
jgi:hypothetical protein